jgi:hypothetical protein
MLARMRISTWLSRRTALLGTAALVCLVTAAVAHSGDSSTTEIPGCAPQCLPQHLIEPGNLPSGKYQTRYVFAGEMKLLFAKGWFSGEDSTGEFWAQPKSNPKARVVFWEDVYAVRSSIPGYPHRVGPVRQTSASLLAWLQKNPNLTVSKPRSGKIGTIPARVVDIGVSDGAVNDDPGCPAKPCANFLLFPQWGEAYGIAGKWISRFYFSDVRYGGQRHLFVAVIEVPGRTELHAFLASASRLIATVRVPASPG